VRSEGTLSIGRKVGRVKQEMHGRRFLVRRTMNVWRLDWGGFRNATEAYLVEFVAKIYGIDVIAF
jgi:hypothetical protein